MTFYTTGNNLAYWSGNKTSLTALQTTSLKDSNSVSINPGFAAVDDLHVNNFALNQVGIPIAAVIDDIDGEPRDTLTPDIGADEFIVLPNDAGIIALASPVAPCPGDTSLIIATIKNYGTDTLFTAIINWELNDTLQTAFNYNDTLLPLQTENITIGSCVFVNGITYKIKIWSSNPNGPPDGNNNND